MELGEVFIARVISEGADAVEDKRLRQLLIFAGKAAIHPETLDELDRVALRTSGVLENEIIDTLSVVYAFNIITRMADTLEFKLQSPEERQAGARALLSRGYL